MNPEVPIPDLLIRSPEERLARLEQIAVNQGEYIATMYKQVFELHEAVIRGGTAVKVVIWLGGAALAILGTIKGISLISH